MKHQSEGDPRQDSTCDLSLGESQWQVGPFASRGGGWLRAPSNTGAPDEELLISVLLWALVKHLNTRRLIVGHGV